MVAKGYNTSMVEDASGQIERFPPLMLHSILTAVRRFEPDFYNHICRVYHLDADRILGLFSEIELLGPGQLIPILKDLREHQSYHTILLLSGRNTFLEHAQLNKLSPGKANGGGTQLLHLIKEEFPRFLGHGSYAPMVLGKQHFIELWSSIFARDIKDERTLCSFYSGFLTELSRLCSSGTATVSEVRCCAADHSANSCLFEINI